MHVYNSLSKKVEELVPVDDKKIMMYVCGLTPYDRAHIGHARTYISFDIIKRYLMKKGYKVYHIQNITDVEDKIIKRCRETAADPKQLTESNHAEALELFARIHILPADIYPKVTENIPEIISMIGKLIEKGSAYETGTGVYFDISTFKGYGKLSGQDLEQIKAGSRFEVDETKRNPADFALWKKTKGDILEFDSPWGRGRPGWHIECSAMAERFAGRTLDIHGGGRDLIFPHHENEIAQSEAATGKAYCRYWLHPGFLSVEGEKMSKSLGNFITLEQALNKSSPNALRLFYIQAHYRSPLDYEPDKLESMEEAVERIFNSYGLIREAVSENTASSEDAGFRTKSREFTELFYKFMDDDFNTPEALGAMYSLLRLANTHLAHPSPDRKALSEVLSSLDDMLDILGLEEEKRGIAGKEEAVLALLSELGGSGTDAEKAVGELIAMRESARKNKDFKRSDIIRSRLKDIGILLEDKADGTRWKIE